MRPSRILLLLIQTSSILLLGQAESKLPDLITSSHPALISGGLIYDLNNKPTAQCHASTLVELNNGIMAAWFGGSFEKNPDVGIWTSVLKGNKWSHPVQVANGFVNDSIRYPCWNPVLFKLKNGTLLLFYKVGPSPSEWWGMLMSSNDEGRTWSSPTKLGEDKVIGHLIGPVKNKPIQLTDGTIIAPSSTETEINEKDQWRVHFEISKDLGKTWSVIGPINDGIEFNAIQPSILTYPNNLMQILCRTQEGSVGQSWSRDNGKTWSKVSATSLPNPNAGTDALTLKDGRQLIVYNHTQSKSEFPSGRNMLNVAISTDGIRWIPILTLERSEGEYSYPAVIQSSNGNIHITYTYKRRSIKHLILNSKKL